MTYDYFKKNIIYRFFPNFVRRPESENQNKSFFQTQSRQFSKAKFARFLKNCIEHQLIF